MCRICTMLHGYQWPATQRSAAMFPGLTMSRRRFLSASLVGAASLSMPMPAFSASRAQETTGPATVVFRGGKIYTVDTERP